MELRAAAEDSIGGANTVAHRTPVGDALTQRAAAAFADAFSLANSISVAVVLTTAAAVVALHRRTVARRPFAGPAAGLIGARRRRLLSRTWGVTSIVMARLDPDVVVRPDGDAGAPPPFPRWSPAGR